MDAYSRIVAKLDHAKAQRAGLNEEAAVRAYYDGIIDSLTFVLELLDKELEDA